MSNGVDHVAICVRDLATSRRFSEVALARPGMGVVEFPHAVGFGAGFPWPWIGPREPTTGVHVAFTAPDRETMDAFRAAALAAGGRANGPPGIRAIHRPSCWGPSCSTGRQRRRGRLPRTRGAV